MGGQMISDHKPNTTDMCPHPDNHLKWLGSQTPSHGLGVSLVSWLYLFGLSFPIESGSHNLAEKKTLKESYYITPITPHYIFYLLYQIEWFY